MAGLSANTRELKVGADLSCGERVICGGIGGPAESIEIGDNVSIGDDVRILARRVKIGDWVTIHNHTTIYGYEELEIGECSWIGQNVILNCTAPLRIGRGCTISAYSNLWTHFSGGDPLQGCRYGEGNEAPCSLGEDAWIGVQCSIAPVSIGEKALVLAGSIVTKDIPRNTVWGGNPARDLTGRLGEPYAELDFEQQLMMLLGRLADWRRSRLEREAEAGAEERVAMLLEDAQHLMHEPYGDGIMVLEDEVDIPALEARGISVFDLRDRTYSKLRSPAELSFMRFLLPSVKFWARQR
ncbi:acyltransferase [bacterium]|nr:acyltransferase [bacterium]